MRRIRDQCGKQRLRLSACGGAMRRAGDLWNHYRIFGQAFSRRTLSDGGLFGISRIGADLEFTRRRHGSPRSSLIPRSVSREQPRAASDIMRASWSRTGTIDNFPRCFIRSNYPFSSSVGDHRSNLGVSRSGRIPLTHRPIIASLGRLSSADCDATGPHSSPLPWSSAASPEFLDLDGWSPGLDLLDVRMTDGPDQRAREAMSVPLQYIRIPMHHRVHSYD